MSLQFHLNKFNPIWTSYSALPPSLLQIHVFFFLVSWFQNFWKISLIGHILVKCVGGLCESQVPRLLLKKLLSLVLKFLQNSMYNILMANTG